MLVDAGLEALEHADTVVVPGRHPAPHATAVARVGGGHGPQKDHHDRPVDRGVRRLSTLDMLREGYDLDPVADALGGVSPAAHDHAMQRMAEAGAQTVTAVFPAAEPQRDWGRAGADDLRAILRRYFPHLGEIRAEA